MSRIEELKKERELIYNELDSIRGEIREKLNLAIQYEEVNDEKRRLLEEYHKFDDEKQPILKSLCVQANELSAQIEEEIKAEKKAAKEFKKQAERNAKFEALPESFKENLPVVMKMIETGNEDLGKIYLLHLVEKVENKIGTPRKIEMLNFNGKELTGFVTGANGRVQIRTIFAGGYNIQRFHIRTIVS